MNDRDLNPLRRTLSAPTMDRRQMIMTALAAGATLPTALSMADRAMAETPKRGGRFRIGVDGGATTDSLDPITHTNQFVNLHTFCIGNHLVEITGEGELVGELAESIEPSADAKTWRFNLRKGVEHHNGKTMTSEDVLASVRHHLQEESKSPLKSSLSQIEELSADGDHAVVFKLKAGSADFPYVLTDYRLAVLPAKDGALDFASGAGTGPYIMDAFEAGVRALYKKNPNYWRSNRGHFDEVELLVLLDSSARQNALTTGEVDAVSSVEAKVANLVGRVPGLRLIEVTGRLHHAWPMRVDAAPFDNVDFRLAVKHALDRQELLDKIHSGRGVIGNDTPISAAYEFYADLPQREQDIDKAKFHLKKIRRRRQSDDPAACLRRRLCRRRGFRRPYEGATRESGHQCRRGARAEGWLLVECLAEKTVVRRVLVRPTDDRLDDVVRLRGRVVLQRRGLAAPEVQ